MISIFCTQFYLRYYIIQLEDSDIDDISTDEKSSKTILIYDILYNTLIGPKFFRTRFHKVDRLIKIYNGTRYLTFFGSKIYDAI